MKNTTSCMRSFRTKIKKPVIGKRFLLKQFLIIVSMIFSLLYLFNNSKAQGQTLPSGNQTTITPPSKKTKPHSGLLTRLKSKFAFDKDEEDEEESPGQSLEFEFKRTKDPATGTVPKGRLLNALEQTLLLQQTATQNKGGGGASTNLLTPLTWTERGPYTDAVGASNGNTRANSGITGGRVRAICVDSGDVNKKTVWVGGVDGGLWKTTDITVSPANWILVNDFLSNLAVSGICQDPTNVNTMYFCTGESYYNFEAVQGVGVFKSTDHGLTWTALASTSAFTHCTRILCDAAGNVYLATRGSGVRRSTNGGTTWTNITPTSAPNSDICDMEYSSTGRLHIVTGIFSTQAYRYTDIPATATSAVGWNSPAVAFPSYSMRAEIAVNGNILYAAPADGSYDVPTIYKSTNGGANWAATAAQPAGGGWANGQGWYSLSVRINPADPNQCIVGGLDNYKTTNGGATWSQISVWVGFSQDYVHADQHELAWWDGGTKMLFGCDGGVHYSSDGGTTIRDRNIGLRVKQFYSVAIHPVTTNYFLAGAQDNGTHLLTQPGLSSSVEVTGGDGAFVAIDQEEPQYQYGAYVYNQYRRSTNGGASWSSVNFSGSQGQFINPFDFDNTANVMYCGNTGGNYRRWTDPHTGSTNAAVTITALNSNEVTALCVSPYTANRVYLGTHNSSGATRICYVDNANTVASGAAGTNISTGLPTNVYTSCIATGTNDNNLMVCFSNYGVQNIWVSTNGGTSWTAIDGNLPDMPVRWCMFFPGDNTKAYIATETGVWETDLINGGTTVWASNATFPTVRTDMIKYRTSDRTIAAGTHGRGVWTAIVPLQCDPPVVNTPTVTQPNCTTPTGTIVVNATNASTMEYSINNGSSWQLSATFSGLAGGSYNIIVRLQGDTNCLTVYSGNPVVLNTVVIPDATISASNGLALTCTNPNTILTVPTPGGTTQIWTLNGNFFASAFNPLVTVGGVYAVTVTHTASGCTATSSVTVTLDNTPPDATISASNGLALSCSNPSTVLTVPTPGGTTQIWTLNGNFFATASNPLVTVGGVYAVTVTNTANGCTATSSVTVTQSSTPPDATISASNGLTFCSGDATVLTIPTPGGTTQIWTLNGNFFASASNPLVTVGGVYAVTVTHTASGCTATSSVTVTVNPNPAPPVSGGNVTVCASATPATLVDIVPNGINVNWWDAATGGTLLLANSATYTTSTAGTYYNEAVDPVTGCISTTRTAVTLTLNQNPAPPVSGGNVTVCASATPATLVDIVPNGINVNWWDAATGGTLLLANSATYTTSTPGTYYNEAVDPVTGCISTTRTAVTLTVNQNPAPPVSGGNVAACASTLPATLVDIVPNGINVNWWDAATAGNLLLANSATYTTSTPGTYYNEAVDPLTGCISLSRTAVTLTVNPNPAPPVSGGDVTVCASATPATLVDIVPNGINVNWWDAATGGTLLLANSATYVTATAGTYYNEAVNPITGCISTTRTAVTLTVNPNPAPPVSGGNVTVCASATPATLVDIVPNGINVNWWDAATGGNLLLANSATYVTSTAGTYYNEAVNPITGCISTTRTAVTLTVNPNPAPPVSGGNVTVCASALPATLVDIVPNGINVNWWSAPTGGTLLIANSATYVTSTAGTYYNEAVNPLTGCISTSRTAVTLTVNPNPAPPVSGGNVTVCASALPATLVDIVPNGINVNWWSAATGGTLLLANSATYVTSTPGTYYNEAVNPVTGCISVTRTAVTLTVNPNPVPTIGGPTAYCVVANLTASGGFSSYLWANGATTQSTVTNLSGTYTVTVTNSFGCTGSVSKTITVSGGVPAQPGVIGGPATVCKNTNVPYSIALVPGATGYTWTAVSGASVSTGQGSANVVINFSNAATNASLSVVANNVCGSGPARTLAYVVSTLPPAAPATLNGTLYGLCNLTNVPYNCTAVAGALSYLWTVPAGVTILTGQGTNSITVKYTGSFTTSGIISVVAQNGCGNSAATSRTVNAKPQQPVISGQNWACKNQAGLVYTVAAVAGATSYTWTPVAGSTITSGQGTTSITYTWGGINGVIKCTANNACGSSLPGSFSVAFTCKEAGSMEDFSELSLYPNPATTSVDIQFDGFAEGKAQLAVYDLIGQQVIKQDVDIVTGNNNKEVDLSSLAKGAYTIRVTYNGMARNCKLIVQ